MSRTGERMRASATAPEARQAPDYRTDIQGLRGIAVALVLLDHAGLQLFAGGYVGVDVFFVISGFLITGHLLATLRERGRLDLRTFYAARARRILPAALVVILLTSVASMLVVSPLRLQQILTDGIAAALYVPNMVFAVRQTDYLGGSAPSPFQHYWSLGIEEQFYLIWPLLLLGLFLLSARRMPRVAIGIAAVAVLSFTACLLLMPISQPWAFFSLPTRAWELAVGALLAATIGVLARVPDRIARVLTWVGLAAIIGSALLLSGESSYPGVAAAIPVLGTAAVIGFGRRQAGAASAVLDVRALQFTGLISYSLYLVHWPVLVLVQEAVGLGIELPPLAGVGLAVISVPLAWLLYRFVEAPFRQRKGVQRGTPMRAVWRSLAASATLAILLSGASAAAALTPLESSRSAAPTTVELAPSGSAFVPSNMSPTLAGATKDTGEIYTNGCQQNLSVAEVVTCSFGDRESPTVVALFGDSHAGRWFPALQEAAEINGFRLDTYTKSGCRSQDTDAAWASADNPTCATWREDAVAALNENPPDTIFMTNHIGPEPGRDAEHQVRSWREGILSSIERLPAESRVVTLADTPEFASSPVFCLASHVDDALTCSVDRDAALNESVTRAQAEAAELTGTGFLDLNDYFCDDERCPAVIGSTLVYSDDHHLTATWNRLLGPVLAQELAALR